MDDLTAEMDDLTAERTHNEIFLRLKDIVNTHNALNSRAGEGYYRMKIIKNTGWGGKITFSDFQDRPDAKLAKEIAIKLGQHPYEENRQIFIYTESLTLEEALPKLDEIFADLYYNAAKATEEKIAYDHQHLFTKDLQPITTLAGIWFPMQDKDRWGALLPQKKEDVNNLLQVFKSLARLRSVSAKDLTNFLNFKIEQLKKSHEKTSLSDLPHSDQQIIRTLKKGIKQIAAELGQGSGRED